MLSSKCLGSQYGRLVATVATLPISMITNDHTSYT
jgi:hypothetical protein